MIGVSDLDLVLFLSGASDRIALQSSLMPDLRIETALVNADTFSIGGSDAWMRFILALSGWHVWGVDIIATLPPPRLGPHAMAHLPRADRWLARWQVYWADETDPADRKDICQWLMKRIIRSLMESQMLQLGAYSRDVYPCSQTAAAAFPDQQSAIWQAAEYAIAPTHARCQIERIVAELEPLLLDHQASLKG